MDFQKHYDKQTYINAILSVFIHSAQLLLDK